MRQLILTGLATEQKFGMKEAQFYLVFNEGELRVPVSQEAAEVVVKEMYEDEQVDEPEHSPPEVTNHNSYPTDDDEVDQI